MTTNTAAAQHLSARNAIVVGAGRGLGRGVAEAFANAGANTIAVARTAHELAQLADTHPGITAEVGDASDEDLARRLITRYDPSILILNARATPVMRDVRRQTWETFSVNWNTDVKIAFTWLREALLRPMPAGSKIVVVSSGAALNGSPLSGGYAGAKATQRFLAQYAQTASDGAGLDIAITTVMPRMTPFGEVGRQGVRAYAELGGQSESEYTRGLGPLTTPEVAGSALVTLANSDPATVESAYLLTGKGLTALA